MKLAEVRQLRRVEAERIRLIFEFGRFVCLCPYDQRHIPKEAHFFWDQKRRAWVSSSYRWAAKLLQYADKETRARLVDHVMGPERDSTMFKPATAGRYGSRR